jgi:hypothetical protein
MQIQSTFLIGTYGCLLFLVAIVCLFNLVTKCKMCLFDMKLKDFLYILLIGSEFNIVLPFEHANNNGDMLLMFFNFKKKITT